MTLLSEASFLVTPNGYKASKLYAAIPTNGNGDMTFTRATTATRVDENDLVSSVASNVPRIDYTGGGCPSILLEPQRTNIVLNSATVVTQTITTAAVANTLSFYGTGTITLSGTFAGTLVGTGATNRVSLTFTPTAGSLVLTVSGSCTNGQLEAGAYPTSYIPTTTIPLTRIADVINRDDIYTNNLIVGGGGTWFVDLENFDTTQAELTLSSGSASNRITFIFYGSAFGNPNKIRFYLASAGLAQVDSLYNTSYTFNQRNKIAFKYKQNDFKIYINGTQVYSDISGSTPIGLSRFDFASVSLTSRFIEGKINQAMVFNEALSDSELQTLTTL